jgi:hypothetical protein
MFGSEIIEDHQQYYHPNIKVVWTVQISTIYQHYVQFMHAGYEKFIQNTGGKGTYKIAIKCIIFFSCLNGFAAQHVLAITGHLQGELILKEI